MLWGYLLVRVDILNLGLTLIAVHSNAIELTYHNGLVQPRRCIQAWWLADGRLSSWSISIELLWVIKLNLGRKRSQSNSLRSDLLGWLSQRKTLSNRTCWIFQAAPGVKSAWRKRRKSLSWHRVSCYVPRFLIYRRISLCTRRVYITTTIICGRPLRCSWPIWGKDTLSNYRWFD